MGGKCGGTKFSNLILFLVLQFFFFWEMKTLLISSDIIRNRNLYTSLLNETRPTPLIIKTPHTQQEGSPIPLSSNPLFFFTESCTLWIRGCSRVARQRILSRRGARECQRDSNPYQSWTSDHHQKSKIMQLEPSWHCLSSRIRSSSRQWLVIYLLLQTDRYFIAQWSIALC